MIKSSLLILCLQSNSWSFHLFSKVSEYLYPEAYIISLGLDVRLFVSLFVARTDWERIEIEVSREF